MCIRDSYLNDAGLTPYLEKLKFNLVGYGCTTCIGNSGPLPEPIADAVQKGKLTVAAVLSLSLIHISRPRGRAVDFHHLQNFEPAILIESHRMRHKTFSPLKSNTASRFHSTLSDR